MAQTLVHGARVLEVDGNFDAALELAEDLADRYPVTLVNSVNGSGSKGEDRGLRDLRRARAGADLHLVPVGNAGNISNHRLGYSAYLEAGSIHAASAVRLPGAGCGADACSGPVKDARRSPPRSGSGTRRPGTRPSAAKESEGAMLAVTDREILAAYRRVAREGLFAEPASAASVAGLLHLHAEGELGRRHRGVRPLSHGLKDPVGDRGARS